MKKKIHSSIVQLFDVCALTRKKQQQFILGSTTNRSIGGAKRCYCYSSYVVNSMLATSNSTRTPSSSPSMSPSMSPSISPSMSPSTSLLLPSTRNHYFSTSAKENKENKLKLKQLIRPFLLTYHPDRLQSHQSSTNISKTVNLKAIQTLNELVDTIDYIYNRAIDPTSIKKNTSRIELKPSYTIEFLIPSTDDDGNGDGDGNGDIKIKTRSSKKQKEAISTRRSVELCFTEKERSIIQHTNTQSGKYSKTAAKMVKLKASREIAKLLRVAKLNIPTTFDEDVQQTENDIQHDVTHKDKLDFHERLIMEELDLDDNDNSSGSGSSKERNNGVQFGRNFDYSQYETNQKGSSKSKRPKTKYERSRNQFMKRIDWKEHARLYEEALEDARRDVATSGLIKISVERKQRKVSEIISRVRLYDISESMDGSNLEEKAMTNANANASESLNPLHQLIAIRRMTLLFTDNFEELGMEEMGKMWQNVTIVLTPERPKGNGEVGTPFSRRKRVREGKESGFKFSFHDESRLTIHVPIDFLDDELIGELKRHVGDFFELCVGDVLAQFFPPNYNQTFKGNPRLE